MRGRYSIGDGPKRNDSLGIDANGSGRDTWSFLARGPFDIMCMERN
jgi:hypothetical protein